MPIRHPPDSTLSTVPLTRTVVLLGVGHTNAHVLKEWKRNPPPNARLVCVSNFPEATYSGMLPGVLSGQYTDDEMRIDLVRATAHPGITLIPGTVVGLDTERHRLLFADRPPLPFDVLSIGIGSVPAPCETIEGETPLLPVKPMQTLLARLETRLRTLAAAEPDRPLNLCIVGAGLGGIEVAMCLPQRLPNWISDRSVDLTLIHGGDRIGTGLNDRTRTALEREFARRGVTILTGKRVTTVRHGSIELDSGEELPVDVVLWIAGAAVPPLIENFDLTKDDRGFLSTDATLRVRNTDRIFAVGDTGSIDEYDLPKAGVYAVRAAPTLWTNIRRVLAAGSTTVPGAELDRYEPQSRFLKLINLGDGRARADWYGLTIAGKWVFRWKDHIDSTFMRKHRRYGMAAEAAPMTTSAPPPSMRCLGCGGKVAGQLLREVLAELGLPERSPDGIGQADDVAVVPTPSTDRITLSTDAFAAPLADHYLSARIAALNALSDLFASAATPTTALVNLTLPVVDTETQRTILRDVLSGIVRELSTHDVALVGGHTIEGSRLEIGLTVLGAQHQTPRTLAAARPGDRLLLTKPIGSGLLLAALMRAKLHSEWWGPLIETLLQPNRFPEAWLDEFDIQAMTDITGFGLAGHLAEMCHASRVTAAIDLDTLPLLPGVEDFLPTEIASTLETPNMRLPIPLRHASDSGALPARTRILFDPQTHGGLLIAIPEQHAETALDRFRRHFGAAAGFIGRCESAGASGPEIVIDLC